VSPRITSAANLKFLWRLKVKEFHKSGIIILKQTTGKNPNFEYYYWKKKIKQAIHQEASFNQKIKHNPQNKFHSVKFNSLMPHIGQANQPNKGIAISTSIVKKKLKTHLKFNEIPAREPKKHSKTQNRQIKSKKEEQQVKRKRRGQASR
jgi:hypothetical protein